MLGGGAILASVVASEPSDTQPVQTTPAPATIERIITPTATEAGPPEFGSSGVRAEIILRSPLNLQT